MTKKHDKKCPLTPRLRFPEFRGAGEWEQKRLDDICIRILQKVTDDSFIPVSITAGQGFVSQESKFGRDISGAQYKNYIILKRGDFAYNKGNSKKFPQGYVCQLKEFEHAAASSAFLCFRFKGKYQAAFFEGLFENNIHGKQLVKYITSSVRNNGLLNINPETFFSILLPIPRLYAEQQRIADCLSSLDARIAAETDKLDALKEHKKGLLKQLFPAEGETTPKLRFPEFRDVGEWEEKEVGEVFKITRGEVLAMPLVSEESTSENLYPVYSSQTKNNGLCGFYKSYLYENAITWTTDGANAGDVKYRNGKFFCTNVCGVLINTNGYANICIAEIINSISKNYVSYVGNPKLMNGVMGKIKIFFPSIEEQQRIAEILASIDELISAQSKKIDLLKDHKKGLMQQLFPCVDEVQA